MVEGGQFGKTPTGFVSSWAKCPRDQRQLNKVYVKLGFLRYQPTLLGYCRKCYRFYNVKWGRNPREVDVYRFGLKDEK